MEHIRTPKVDNVRLLDNHSRNSTEGTLYLTATHLIFVDRLRKGERWIVHTHIQTVEKLNLIQSGSPLRIRCKNFQVLTFLIGQERDCHDLYSSLLKLSKPVKINELYAFSYNPREEQLSQQDGWDLFSLNNQFLQMGLPTRFWKVTRINNEFGLCDTYPKTLCVPSLATPALMLGSAAFRSKKRLPALSYLHKNGSAIVRCSQPMAGLNSRSIEDEAYVDLIRRSKPNANDFMYIVDTRPMINAVANRAQGKGYENTDFYENIKYHFLGIDNIHVMRTSLNKLLEACDDSSCSVSTWLEGINSSGWLRHVYNVLQVSKFIANAAGVENRNVIVHCSDGWDRTAQTCSLASIMLNPHYRTIDGFLALVQKEWIHFGHKFTHRCGHLDGDNRETSPVFTQFIDATWQLMRLKPCAFQFTEKLLFDLHDHVFSCQFGTFLGNCAKDKQQHNLMSLTYSLWGWMMKRSNTYTNSLYRASVQHQEENQLLLPPSSPHFVQFWRAMYNRHDQGLQPREKVDSAVIRLNEESNELTQSVKELKIRRNELRKKLGIKIPDEDVQYISEPRTKQISDDRPEISKPLDSVEINNIDSSPSCLALKELQQGGNIDGEPTGPQQNHTGYSPSPKQGRKGLSATIQPNELLVSFSSKCLSDSEENSSDMPEKYSNATADRIDNGLNSEPGLNLGNLGPQIIPGESLPGSNGAPASQSTFYVSN